MCAVRAICGMLDARRLVSVTYELEGDRLEIMLTYERIKELRAFGRAIEAEEDGCLPNVDAVLRRLIVLKKGTQLEKYFQLADRAALWPVRGTNEI